MECLFCKIVDKEIGARVIYEDEESLAFLDIHPQSPGHSVVIPKLHAKDILELPAAKLGSLFAGAQKVTQKISNTLAPDGFTIGINHGKVSGQTVDHLHVHILPRFHSDGGGSIHSVVSNPPKETLDEIAKKILG